MTWEINTSSSVIDTCFSCSEGAHTCTAHVPEFKQKVKVINRADKVNDSYLNSSAWVQTILLLLVGFATSLLVLKLTIQDR